MTKVKSYPLELYFPEDRHDFNKVLEYVKNLEQRYNVQYYCQMLDEWIWCKVLEPDNNSNNNEQGHDRGNTSAKSLKSLLDKL